MSTVTWDVRQPEPCTSWARRKRHYSDNLRPAPYAAGRIGWALCGVDAMDEEHLRKHWGHRGKDIAAMPECKKCVRRMR